ncbi:hypothetical protein [Paenibacillus azoreducens]|uniref:Uncharacterized protein n=1 Tax=Paenibacillus azoreducens TaxID=116718 RepID=A0A919YHM5_9BACL|nr:hypothetical protein [Paenibacillus azoreducens]GIO48855.1 hypothetical protein J34TS1_36200 [Paenibacillus azoreducens]
MRNLVEILEEVKHGNKPEYEELLYALLAYASMFNIEHRQLREELMRDKPQPLFLRDMKLKNSFDMYKRALNTDPKDWLGWSNDPENPEYQKILRAGANLIDNAAARGKVVNEIEGHTADTQFEKRAQNAVQ